MADADEASVEEMAMCGTKYLIRAGLLAALLLSWRTVAAQQSPSATNGASSDQAFLKQALGVNQLELQLGRLAADRASTPEVKATAQKMVQKHTEFGRHLSDLAKQLGMSGDPEMSQEQVETLARVQSKSGADFDAAFKQTVDAGHVKELAMYREEVRRAVNPQLRTLAQQRVAALERSMASTAAADQSKKATR